MQAWDMDSRLAATSLVLVSRVINGFGNNERLDSIRSRISVMR
jgi:hypothetical protein